MSSEEDNIFVRNASMSIFLMSRNENVSSSSLFRFDAQLTGDQLMVGHRVGLVDPNIRKTVRGDWDDEEVE